MPIADVNIHKAPSRGAVNYSSTVLARTHIYTAAENNANFFDSFYEYIQLMSKTDMTIYSSSTGGTRDEQRRYISIFHQEGKHFSS